MEVVQLLLGARADKDIVSNSGDTALSYASAKNTEIVRLLSSDATENYSQLSIVCVRPLRPFEPSGIEA